MNNKTKQPKQIYCRMQLCFCIPMQISNFSVTVTIMQISFADFSSSAEAETYAAVIVNFIV